MASGLMIALTACGGSGFSYISSAEYDTYFKVPESWHVFETEEVLEGRTASQLTERFRFLRILDADPKPSLDRTFDQADYPYGIVQIRQLTSTERDEFSLQRLRNEIVEVDSIIEEKPDSFDLLGPPLAIGLNNGIAGARHVYTVNGDTGAWTVNQTGLVDGHTLNVYFFAVGCKAECYANNQSVIEEVVDSWTIKDS